MKLFSKTARRDRRQARRRSRSELFFDRFEERVLLSIFSVTNNTDAGPGSLRQTMIDANGKVGADTIHFNIALGAISETASGAGPQQITATSDGTLWFTEQAANKIGKLTSSGILTEFPIPTAASGANGITVGPDGNLWFTEQAVNKIGKMKPDGTFLGEFTIPTANSGPFAIVAGPDGNLWFTEETANKIGVIQTDGTFVNEFTVPTANSQPRGIISGAGNSLWFTEFAGNKVGQISTAGAFLSEKALANNSGPLGIAFDSSNNVWFTEQTANKIGRIDGGGTLGEINVPTAGSSPSGIAIAPDGNPWFTEGVGNKVGRVVGGAISEFAVPTAASGPAGIASSPDGNLWFAQSGANQIGRVTVNSNGLTISPQTQLPMLSEQTTIDDTVGTTGVTIDGSNIIQNGFVLGTGSDSSTIKGLTIQNFAGAAISVQSASDVIQQNVLGVSGKGNQVGVLINGASNVTIGGAGVGNTIQFNSQQGILILSGNQNTVSENLYAGTNGPNLTVQANDIVLLPGTNNDQPSPSLQTVYLANGKLNAEVAAVPGIIDGTTIELYAITTSPARRSFIGSGQLQDIGGILTVSVNPGAIANGDQIIATATDATTHSTSAFSTAQTVAPLYVVTTNGPNGPGSLYQAILNANAHSGQNTISFNIQSGSKTISPTASLPLPAIIDRVTVDGTSQSGIILDGAGLTQDGLVLDSNGGNTSTGSTIQGLTIQHFAGAGIRVRTASNKIEQNVLGTGTSGNQWGVWIDGGSGNTIGGASGGQANTILANSVAGIQISGNSAANNVIENNRIGVDASQNPVGNQVGVLIINASDNTVGQGNTVGGNAQQGVSVVSGNNNVITQNGYVGSNGPSPVPQANDIALGGTANNGLTAPSLVSASLDATNLIVQFNLGVADGTSADIELYQVVGSPAQRSFLGHQTVTVSGLTSVSIPKGSLVNGSEITATATVAGSGTSAFSASLVIADLFTVKNTDPNGPGSLYQALLNAANHPGTDTIKFNIPSGPLVIRPTAAFPLVVTAATGPNAVIIDGTTQAGIIIDGSLAGAAADGIVLAANSDNSVVKGLTIQKFGGAAVHIKSSGVTVTRSIIGVSGQGNQLGIFLDGATGAVIGGAAGSANTIGFNAQQGVYILGGGNNAVQGNLIGTDAGNADRGNGIGVLVSGSSNNTIGGAGLGNTIGFNTQQGVTILSGKQNFIEQNLYVAANGTATPTEASDIIVGAGANGDQLPPELQTAQVSVQNNNKQLTLQLTAQAAGAPADADISIEVYFIKPGSTPQRIFLGMGTVKNKPDVQTVGITVPQAVQNDISENSQIIATASFDGNGTSAFSKSIGVLSNLVVTNTNTHDTGSLYYAIQQAKSGDRITFNISGASRIIQPTSDFLLDVANKHIIIDGTTQPGVVIDGTNLKTLEPAGQYQYYGIKLDTGSGGSAIKGLTFTNFVNPNPANGFDDVGILITSSGNLIVGVTLGEATQGNAKSNDVGLAILDATSNSIGGDTASDPINTVIGNRSGIVIDGSSATGNIIQRNLVGVGAKNNGNGDGILVKGAPNNRIGGSNSANSTAGNQIGNNTNGIRIEGAGATGNHIEGNFIGVDPQNPTRNSYANTVGISITAPNNFIGSGSEGALSNVVGRNTTGVSISGALGFGNRVEGNLIGTDGGRNDLPNNTGIVIDSALGNLIGGASDAAANVIGFNSVAGISLTGNAQQKSGYPDGNLVQGNYIGTDQSGASLSNKVGISISSASNTIGPGSFVVGSDQFGSADAKAANTISGSLTDGLEISGDSNLIVGNLIGATSSATLGNIKSGISLTGGTNNTIGGALTIDPATKARSLTLTVANSVVGNTGDGILVIAQGVADPSNLIQGNLLSRNLGNGIHVKGVRLASEPKSFPNPATVWASIQDNFIGTDATGTSAYDNVAGSLSSLGNVLSGVLLETDFGGLEATVSGNVIAGNGLSGVTVSSAQPGVAYQVKVAITGNTIGLDKTASFSVSYDSGTKSVLPLGNVLDGVLIDNVLGVTVGGPFDPLHSDQDPRNIISGNLGRGIEIRGNLLAGQGLTGDPLLANDLIRNFIGTDGTGKRVVSSPNTGDPNVNPGNYNVGNLGDGIFLFIPQDTNVEDNLVSGNRAAGIHPTTQQNTIGGTSGGTASGSTSTGILTIRGNYIGTDVTGTTVAQTDVTPNVTLGNGSDGIFLDSIQRDLSDPAKAKVSITENVISGNRANGINLLDTKYVTIRSNLIGTDKDGSGTIGLGNSSNGIFVNGSSNNSLGGALILNPDGSFKSSTGNVISGNSGSGIFISGAGATGNLVTGNVIGLEKKFQVKLSNQVAGVVISGASGNSIGDSSAGAGNVISGNRLYGIQVADAPGANDIAGNWIGTNPQNTALLGNSADGVFLLNSASTNVGIPGAGNTIGGNQGNGVQIFGQFSHDNLVSGNLIGLGSDGLTPIPNQGNGVYLNNAGVGPHLDPITKTNIGPNLVIGNVISGNAQSGVMLQGGSDGSGNILGKGNKVQGNFIGTDREGLVAIRNGGYGVLVYGSQSNTIGAGFDDRITLGALSLGGKGNLISGNGQSGITIFSPAASAIASTNIVAGNLIGTNRYGKNAIPNNGNGVEILSGRGEFIGLPGAFNLISGNLNSGIFVTEITSLPTSSDPTLMHPAIISGNYIGTDISGTGPLGGVAQQYGIAINNSSLSVIGSSSTALLSHTNVPSAPTNLISANALTGVVLSGSSTGNLIRGSYIGVDKDGRSQAGLGNQVGVLVNRSGGNIIGSSETGGGNLITQSSPATNGNGPVYGIEILGPPVQNATGNLVQGNLIGLDRDGKPGTLLDPKTPSRRVVGVSIQNFPGNVIGVAQGPANVNTRNVISGNGTAGVELTGVQGTGNIVNGNFIGSDPTGTMMILPWGAATSDAIGTYFSQFARGTQTVPPTQNVGVLINQASLNTIGGGAIGTGNVLSGNLIGVDIEGSLGDSTKGARNVVQGNFIGTDPNGMLAVPNLVYGVQITGSPLNAVSSNLISANGVAGVFVFSGAPQTSTATKLGNTIVSNLIGTNALRQPAFPAKVEDMAAHPNIINPSTDVTDVDKAHYLPTYLGYQLHGIAIIGSSQNTIGVSGRGNLLSGNILTGIYLTSHDFVGATFAAPSSNPISGNRIIANGMYGVFRFDAPAATNPVRLNGLGGNTVNGNPQAIGDFTTGITTRATIQPNPHPIYLPSSPVNFDQPFNAFAPQTTPRRPVRRPLTRPRRTRAVSTALTAASSPASSSARPRIPALTRAGEGFVRVIHPAARKN